MVEYRLSVDLSASHRLLAPGYKLRSEEYLWLVSRDKRERFVEGGCFESIVNIIVFYVMKSRDDEKVE